MILRPSDDVVPMPTSGSSRPKAMVVMGERAYAELFDDALRSRLHALLQIDEPDHVADLDSPATRADLADVEVLVTGWGSPRISAEVLDAAPLLRAIFHTGGSVKGHVSDACWERGIVITSASDANSIPVAEFTLATILLEGKRARTFARHYRVHRDGDDSWRRDLPPVLNHRGTVGLVGFSRVGRRVASLLGSFDFEVLVTDPYADPAQVAASGARLVSLHELLAQSDIVSLHAPELPATRHLIDRDRLAMMKDGAVLINTARGSLVDMNPLIDECRSERIRAVLDVTEPEPLPADSPLYELPGVELTPHIAGSIGAETHRMTVSTLDEVERYIGGRPLLHGVDGHALEYIA